MTTLFISDLHLSAERPEKIVLFRTLLEHCASVRCEALYILGDLVEAWLGDDDDTPPIPEIVTALRHCSDAGVPVSVMRGNRDFLMGRAFSGAARCVLLEDPSVIDLYGRRALLMHGDTLCTRDLDYQALRRRVRDPAWQAQVLSLPLAERRRMAAKLRSGSQVAMAGKDEIIMDVEPAAVEAAMREHNVQLLIHGHTHRPAIHRMTLDGRDARRVVLGDWYESDSCVSAGPDGERLMSVAELVGASDA